jgi:hypothetical protein
MKHIFLLFLVVVCFEVVSQDSIKKPLKYQIGVSYSADYSYISGIKNPYEDDFTFFNGKNGFSIGLNFNKKLKNNLSVNVGLLYSQSSFYQKYRYEHYFYSISSSMKLLLEDLTLSFYQNINYIEAPIKLRYVFRTKQKFNFLFNFGIYPSFYMKSENRIESNLSNFNEDENDFALKTGNTDYLKENINVHHNTPVLLSYNVGVGFEYKLIRNYSMVIQTELRKKINFEYKERITNIGLSIGLMYNF